MTKTIVLKDECPEMDVKLIPDDEEIRCHLFNDKLGRVCNKLLGRGRPPTEPIELWCDRCKKAVIVQRIN